MGSSDAESGPSTEDRRRFTIVDGMALVAVAAAGLALDRPSLEALPYVFAPSSTTAYPIRIGLASGALFPLIAAYSVALTLLGLRRGGPSSGRPPRGPGFVACAAATVALAAKATWYGLVWISTSRPNPAIWPLMVWEVVARQVGYAVAGAWLALALSGRWCPSPSWTDRLGRFLGVCWVAAAVQEIVITALQWAY